MDEEEKELLRQIVGKLDKLEKLDTLIALSKLSNRSTLDEIQRNLERDKVAMRILELSDGTVTYSNLAKQVHDETGVAEITVKKKMSDLKSMGLITSRRDGKETYYESTGLLG